MRRLHRADRWATRTLLLHARGAAEGEITTIEGLSGEGEPLHPMQAAFVEQDAYQCG